MVRFLDESGDTQHRGTMKTTRHSGFVRLWLAGAVLLAAAPLLPISGAGAADSAPVQEVAKLPLYFPTGVEPGRFSGNGAMILNPPARRAYQIFRLSAQTFVQAIDLDTLRLVRSATFRGAPIGGSAGSTFGEFVNVVDEARNRLYLPYNLSGGRTLEGIYEIDGTSLAVVRDMTRNEAFRLPDVDPNRNPCTAVSCVPTPVGINPEIRGMAFVPAINSPTALDKLLLLLQDSPAGAPVVWVAQWDIASERQDWIYRVTACASRNLPNDPLSRYQMDLFQSTVGPYIYLGCFAQGGTGQAVRLEVDTAGRPVTEVGFPGPLGLIDVLADPEADRLLLKIVNDEGESYWVFDGPSSSYVGVIGTTIGTVGAASGIDRTTGRLYVLAPRSVAVNRSDPGGLFMADARRTPAPQAIVFPQFATGSVYRIQIDPATGDRPRRVFVLPAESTEYRVLRDAVDISVDPPVADQDRFTTDTPEIAGVTESNYTGTAHAYGLRALFVGGLEGASPSRGTLLQLRSPCLPPDREIVFARVRQAGLSSSLASAGATAGDAEQITRTDLQQPGNRCYPRGLGPQGFDALNQENIGPLVRAGDTFTGHEWPFNVAECAGDTDSSHPTASLKQRAGVPERPFPSAVPAVRPPVATPGPVVHEIPLAGFTSSAICDQSDSKVTATAGANVFSVPSQPAGTSSTPGVSVGQMFATVHLARHPARGLVVRSESWVKDIEVHGVFSIEQALTRAEAHAAGRTGTAGTTFTRVVCGVRVAKEALDQDQDVVFEGCYDLFAQTPLGPQPNINNQLTDRPLIAILNRALGTRGRVRVPDPDFELAKGTPGGYLASLQKNRGEEVQARAISNDASTEVPAMEVIMFNDDQFNGVGRQLYQFAGVDASSTYGIFLPPTTDFLDDAELEDTSLPDLLIEMTGGFPDFAATLPAVPAAARKPVNVLADGLNRALKSLKWFARTPRDAALASLVWLLLGFPVYLATRRKALLARRRT